MATKSAPSKSASITATPGPAAPAKAPKILAGNAQPNDTAARKSTVSHFEAALKLLHAGKFDKAHEAFTKLLPDAPADIAPTVRMYLNTCATEIAKGAASFSNNEERYDYAISLLNHGHFEDAREHFETILGRDNTADYAFYGMALLAAMTGDCPHCIDHLTEAIRLNPQNRIQARGDSDFAPVSDDPSFTELLYPEV
jgi:tetratricopeptide (TPR) repeat protein